MSAPTYTELAVLNARLQDTLNGSLAAISRRRSTQARRRPAAWQQQARMESLTRADAHISRCGTCGAQVWDGKCRTCIDFDRRTTNQSKENQ